MSCQKDIEMDYCTICCCNNDLSILTDTIKSSLHIEAEPLTDDIPWKQLQIGSAGQELIFTALPYTEPNDPFSKSLLGVINFLRSVQTEAVENKSKLISRLSKSRLLIGVKAPSGLNQEAKHIETILLTTLVMDGYVFTGSDMLSPEGLVILARDGSYDTTI